MCFRLRDVDSRPWTLRCDSLPYDRTTSSGHPDSGRRESTDRREWPSECAVTLELWRGQSRGSTSTRTVTGWPSSRAATTSTSATILHSRFVLGYWRRTRVLNESGRNSPARRVRGAKCRSAFVSCAPVPSGPKRQSRPLCFVLTRWVMAHGDFSECTVGICDSCSWPSGIMMSCLDLDLCMRYPLICRTESSCLERFDLPSNSSPSIDPRGRTCRQSARAGSGVHRS